MATSNKYNREKIAFRVNSATLFRNIEKYSRYKNPLFIYSLKNESKKIISFL